MVRNVNQATVLLFAAFSLVSCENSDGIYRSGYNYGSVVGFSSAFYVC